MSTERSENTGELYDQHASRWQRREPSSLSDFTGRPPVFELCGDVTGLNIIDLGCGEGYCSRELAARGAQSILGVELSAEMVQLAQQQEADLGQGIEYRQGDVTALDAGDEQFDLALGVFVYNYLSLAQMQQSFAEVFRVLRPGGQFVFSVPHPAFAFIRTTRTAPFFFDAGDAGYFSARDALCAGEIYRRTGTALPVQMIHKTVSDYMMGLRQAGFCHMPEVRELAVTAEHLALDPDFFGPVQDTPLHMAFRVQR